MYEYSPGRFGLYREVLWLTPETEPTSRTQWLPFLISYLGWAPPLLFSPSPSGCALGRVRLPPLPALPLVVWVYVCGLCVWAGLFGVDARL